MISDGKSAFHEEIPWQNEWRRAVEWKRTGNSCSAYSLAAACWWRVLQISRYLWYFDLRILINNLFILSCFALFPRNSFLVWYTMLRKIMIIKMIFLKLLITLRIIIAWFLENTVNWRGWRVVIWEGAVTDWKSVLL